MGLFTQECVPGWDVDRIAALITQIVEAELDCKQTSERDVIDLLELILIDKDGPAEACFREVKDRNRVTLQRVAWTGFLRGFQAATGPKD